MVKLSIIDPLPNMMITFHTGTSYRLVKLDVCAIFSTFLGSASVSDGEAVYDVEGSTE